MWGLDRQGCGVSRRETPGQTQGSIGFLLCNVLSSLQTLIYFARHFSSTQQERNSQYSIESYAIEEKDENSLAKRVAALLKYNLRFNARLMLNFVARGATRTNKY
jgi:hypothetical protein